MSICLSLRIAIKCILLCISTCFYGQFYGQFTIDDIRLEQIHQKKIRKYIECLIEENKHQFSEIHPTWNSGTDCSGYSKNEMTFFFDGSLRDIWNGYISANPSRSWNGRKVSFGVLLQKFPSNILYDHDPINCVDTGQIYFLNLKLLYGISKLPVAFEIITVDTLKKIIEFSYIEGNKSSGVQQIKFTDVEAGVTKIIHTSYFKSDSRFRDKWIYPFFHKKIVKDFHRNMSILLNLRLRNRFK